MVYFEKELTTNGKGLWSRANKIVKTRDLSLSVFDEDFGELRVQFDTSTWDTNEDGLIYTDPLFLEQLKEALNEAGLWADDVDYSEQGMQGDDYVSLDVGSDFINSWNRTVHF